MNTAVCVDFFTQRLSVNNFEAVSEQGSHYQWNRTTQGETYIMNQKGGGVGGVFVGEVTSGDLFTSGLYVLSTPGASATVASQVGRFDVTGTSTNTGTPASGLSLVSTALGCKEMLRCSAGGKAEIQIFEDVSNVAGIEYDATTNASTYYNTQGASFYQGQTVGTVARQPTQYLGGSVGTQNAVTVNTNYIVTSVDAVWDSGTPLKTSITLPLRGHWMVYSKAQLVAATNSALFVYEIYVDATLTESYQQHALVTNYAVLSGVLILDCKADGSLVELRTQGAGTSGASSTFELVAIRIG